MPEETKNYIHASIKDSDKFVTKSFKTISISREKGISAVVGKLKSNPSGSTTVQKHLFIKSKDWTMPKVESWVKSHKGDDEMADVKEAKTASPAGILDAKVKGLVKFNTHISKVEILKAEDAVGDKPATHKKAIVSGEFFDDSVNKNFFRINKSVHTSLSGQVNGMATKVAHSYNDWEMVGTGLSGEVSGNTVRYKVEVTAPRAVEMFETGTWNEKNMGVSPSIDVRDAEVICSICGADAMKDSCEHWPGHVYGKTKDKKGKICWYDISGKVHLVEGSFTSMPAYGPDSGTVDEVTFAASLMKIIKPETFQKSFTKQNDLEIKKAGQKPTEDGNMEGNEAIDSLVAKGEEITKLQAKVTEQAEKIAEFEKADVTKMEAELKETKASLKEASDKLKEKTDLLAKTEIKLEVYTKASREAELTKIISSKEVVASIIEKKLSDVDFKAEVVNLQKIKASYEVQAGSAPVDSADASQKGEFDTEKYLASMGIANPFASAN